MTILLAATELGPRPGPALQTADRWERERPTRARILLVDDDDAIRNALATALRGAAFSIATARGGDAALVEAARELPDLVITDLSMPGMDGLELCARLRALDPELPIILVTGHPDTDSAIASVRAGIDDYLSKPLDLEVLFHRIDRTLERRNAKAEIARLGVQTRLLNGSLIARAILEQESAQAAVRHQAQLLALLEKLSDGVVLAEPSGRIVLVNRVAQELCPGNRPATHVDDLDSVEIQRPDGTPCPAQERPLARALRGEEFGECELIHVGADGVVRRLITSGTSVRDARGNVDLAIVVLRDVTELRRVERERDEYVALISHDLRSPLNSIVLASSLLKELNQSNERFEAGPIIDRLARNALRMGAMIAELLESTRLELQGRALDKERCDLRGLVAVIVRDLQDPRRPRIVFTAGDEPACVLAETPRIERAIVNLITNALKYSPDDTTVRISVGREGGDVVVEVGDSGIGIAAQDLPKLLQRGYRAPNGKRVAGLGLGLYITDLVARAHGGRIDVTSELGKGSTFRLRLPSM